MLRFLAAQNPFSSLSCRSLVLLFTSHYEPIITTALIPQFIMLDVIKVAAILAFTVGTNAAAHPRIAAAAGHPIVKGVGVREILART